MRSAVQIKSPEKYPQSSAVIRFQDCDPFGHLNNARYLDYFINAREDHLVDYYGLDIYKRQKQTHENWVITGHRIAYLAPVVFREKVVIRTCLIAFSENSIWMEGIMLSGDESRLKAVLWTQFRYFSFKTGKAMDHTSELMDFWGTIATADLNVIRAGFQARVEVLKSDFRETPNQRARHCSNDDLI